MRALASTQPDARAIVRIFALAMTLILVHLFARTANAYIHILDTADILPEGFHRLHLSAQGIVNAEEGTNLMGRYATHFSTDSELQFEVGGGTSLDFNTAAYFKYTPFPDTEAQPAVGVRLGATYGRANGNSLTALLIQPMVSKGFETDYGRLAPYASVPLSIVNSNHETYVPLHFVAGTEWRPADFQKVRFFVEGGFNFVRAFNFVALGASVDFDNTGLRFE